MDAEIYGIIPNAKMEAFAKAPPENIFNRPSSPLDDWFCRLANIPGSTPGKTT
jgi:hypothetical protein